MPLVFNTGHIETGIAYRTTGPLPEDATFYILTDNRSGVCVVCRQTQSGLCWGGDAWVMCARCAVDHYGAYDLRTGLPSEQEVPEPVPLTTKRDKAFDPAAYRIMTHPDDLSGRSGCSGYKCETTEAPLRTITGWSQYWTGNGTRGNLCQACYLKLKTKYDTTPRARCDYCEQNRLTSAMVQTVHRNMVCNVCIRDYFMQVPRTDGGWIERDRAVWLVIGPNRLYASPQWAEAHWFQAGERWYETQEQADAVMFARDAAYCDDRVMRHVTYTVFSYGTNVVKMLGFPTVTPKDALCLGVELEMIPRPECTHEAVVAALGGKWVPERPYILCRDGSLGDAGVEMITLPYTLDAHKSDKYVPWKATLANLRHVAISGKLTKACGMHVHINRRALSQLQMGKMLLVVNAPEMQELICCIAQRNDGGYAHRKFTKVSDGKLIQGTHFDALNIATNKGTCELRIFRGNLRYERVMKNLEFTEALCMYAAQQSIQLLTDPACLVEWIHSHAAHYPYLSKFLKEQYKPTKLYAAKVKVARTILTSDNWRQVAVAISVSETEGDI